MTAYTVAACYGHRSCPSPVGAVVVLETLLTVGFLLILTGSSCRRMRTIIGLCIDKLDFLDKLHLHGPRSFGCVYDILQNGIAVLVHVFSRFPFSTTTVNTWFQREGVSREMGVVHVINLDSIGRGNRCYSPQYGVAFPDGLADDQHRLFFHGTSHEGAQSIMTEGIDLSKGTKAGDFSTGNGFYLTDEFNTAFEWADSRYNRHSQPAVLVFKFDMERLGNNRKFKGLNLVENATRNEWVNVIVKCRSGKGLKKRELEGNSFIEGPMATISKDRVGAVPHSYQLCILSEELAEAFDECLHSVVFHSAT